jgi:hypothetical protein
MNNKELVQALQGVQSSLVQLAAMNKQASSSPSNEPSSIKITSMGIVKQASYAKYLDAFSQKGV